VPFAKRSVTLQFMTGTSATKPLFRTKRLKPYRGRGEIYSWLRAHHEEIADGLMKGELFWAILAAEMVRAGVNGARAAAPTAKAAARVWRRVERDIEVETAGRTGERPKRKYPSRISPDWRPPLVSGALGGAGARDETKVAPSVNGSVSGRAPPADAAIEFLTVDADGKPLEDGKVFYRGQVMSRRAAEEIERLTRGLREEDRHR
jgi:hypothetical protein